MSTPITKEYMVKRLHSLVLGTALLLAALASPAQAQEEGSIGVMFFTGAQNTPTSFDVFRDVEYDTGLRVGGGLVFNVDEWVGVRGDFGYTSTSGQGTGAVSEEISFQRRYFGAELQLRYPRMAPFTPYLMGGGGLVAINRESPDYSYDMTEGAATFGVGASYQLGSVLSAFVEGKGWLYARQTVGETQLDRMVDIGLVYTLPL